MKLGLILSVLWYGVCFSQVEHVQIIKKESMYPNIKGYYEGEIPYFLLCDESGIVCSKNLKIVEFTIQYGNGEQDKIITVKGNVIPQNICNEISLMSINNMIFITKVFAIDEKEQLYPLTSFNLIPIKK
jgi:hypothetical protein